MTETLRTFIAAPLPEGVIAALQRLRDALRTNRLPIRWVGPRNSHLTLAFLGNVQPEQLAVIDRAAREACRNRGGFDLSARGLGVFPSPSRPRVVWVGIGGALDPLTGLKRELDRRLAAAADLAYVPEKRSYRPHLTLGRIKGNIDGGRLAAAMRPLADFEPVPFRVAELALIKSELTPHGARYSLLEAFPLAAGG
jgi:2'-5' RNA ligase